MGAENGEKIIPVTHETLSSHSCVNQTIMQLRYAVLTEEQALELMNEAIDYLMNSGWFERDGKRMIEAGMIPGLTAE